MQFSVPTPHSDIIHDVAFDTSNQLLATCSSDRQVQVFSVGIGRSFTLIANLTGHEGPVWRVAWSAARHGPLLASASADGTAIVWGQVDEAELPRGLTDGQVQPKVPLWRPFHVITRPSGGVNAVSWAPESHGCVLAVASSDGVVSVAKCDEMLIWHGTIQVTAGVSHAGGATAVSFLPWDSALVLGSAGCDKMVRLWQEQNGRWHQLCQLGGHTDWIRDFTFSSAILPGKVAYFASSGQDKSVFVRSVALEDLLGADKVEESAFTTSVTNFTAGIWRTSWSPDGTLLTLTTSDKKIMLLTEGVLPTDPWIELSSEI